LKNGEIQGNKKSRCFALMCVCVCVVFEQFRLEFVIKHAKHSCHCEGLKGHTPTHTIFTCHHPLTHAAKVN